MQTSIIIPTLDRAPLIGVAIDSILGQCQPEDQIIVVDDGSIDGTADILRSYGTRLHVLFSHHEHSGPAGARNAGLAIATGERLAFLDSDDLWDPSHQQVLHSLLDQEPSLDLAFGLASEFVDEPSGRREVRRVPGACCGALLARRSAFAVLGPFRTDLRLGEFIDWMGRARRLGLREVTADVVVLHRRSHAGNMTRRERSARGDYATVLRDHLAARRTVPDP